MLNTWEFYNPNGILAIILQETIRKSSDNLKQQSFYGVINPEKNTSPGLLVNFTLFFWNFEKFIL